MGASKNSWSTDIKVGGLFLNVQMTANIKLKGHFTPKISYTEILRAQWEITHMSVGKKIQTKPLNKLTRILLNK